MIAQLMGLRTISPAELDRARREGSVHVFDLNPAGRWLEARVPGALNLEPGAFEASRLPDERSAALVFYCSGPLCRKAPNAARRARQLGYSDVRVLSAGISGWIGAGLPTESGQAS